MLIEILDPVGRSKYVLEVDRKIAHRLEVPEWKGGAQAARQSTSGMGVGTVVVPAQDGRPELKTEILGTQIMEGVTVEGKRQTTTWPVGAMGNDQPLVAVTESWMSVELGLPVLVKSDDPRNGATTRRMTELRRGEPDAALFRPPDGWTVVEGRGPFSMRFPAAQ